MILTNKLNSSAVFSSSGHAPIASLFKSDRKETVHLALMKQRRLFTNTCSLSAPSLTLTSLLLLLRASAQVSHSNHTTHVGGTLASSKTRIRAAGYPCEHRSENTPPCPQRLCFERGSCLIVCTQMLQNRSSSHNHSRLHSSIKGKLIYWSRAGQPRSTSCSNESVTRHEH